MNANNIEIFSGNLSQCYTQANEFNPNIQLANPSKIITWVRTLNDVEKKRNITKQ